MFDDDIVDIDENGRISKKSKKSMSENEFMALLLRIGSQIIHKNCVICHTPIVLHIAEQSLSSGEDPKIGIKILGMIKEYSGTPICLKCFWKKSGKSKRTVTHMGDEIRRKYNVR